ncbi:MAG: TatD family hydrolase, partial [Candidatus Bipolaricaulia bacterium]
MLIDTHAHLDDSRFETDLDEVVVRAGEAGVEKILTLGTDSASSRANLQLALKHRSVYVAVGFHPHQAASFDDATTVELERLAAYPKVVAIGEIG